MAKKFLVRTSGEVTQQAHQEHTYIIKASSKDEAMKLGQEIFSQDYDTTTELRSTAEKFHYNSLSISAILLLGVAIFLSFLDWHTSTSLQPASFSPDLKSMSVSLVFYLSFAIRFKEIFRKSHSFVDYVLMGMVVTIFANLINIVLVNKELQLFFWTIPFDSVQFIFLAILLSWIGLPIISVGCYILVAIFSLSNLTFLSEAMGLFGWLYALLVFWGLLLYARIEKNFFEINNTEQVLFNKGIGYFNSTFQGAKTQSRTIQHKVQGRKMR